MVLPFELEPTLPFQSEELVFDFQTIETPETGDSTNLLAVAIEKSELDPFLKRHEEKTLIEPIIEKRLAEELEKKRLKEE